VCPNWQKLLTKREPKKAGKGPKECPKGVQISVQNGVPKRGLNGPKRGQIGGQKGGQKDAQEGFIRPKKGAKMGPLECLLGFLM